MTWQGLSKKNPHQRVQVGTGNPDSPLLSIKATVMHCRMWVVHRMWEPSLLQSWCGLLSVNSDRIGHRDKAAKCQLSLLGLQHLGWTSPAVTPASPPSEKLDHLLSNTSGAGSAHPDCGILHSRWRNPDSFLSCPALFSHSLYWTDCIAELGHPSAVTCL